MIKYLSKIALIIALLVACANRTNADEPMQLSERLALTADFDPMSIFGITGRDFAKHEQMVTDIIDYAKSFLGRPYSRGSKGPKAFDCSGFTSFIFKNFDIRLAASSGAQYLQGEGIDVTEVRPGDLVFFSGRGGGKSRVGHVGMAVDVDDDGTITFIHAATSSGIRYDQYPDGGYYSNRFIGARRVIN